MKSFCWDSSRLLKYSGVKFLAWPGLGIKYAVVAGDAASCVLYEKQAHQRSILNKRDGLGVDKGKKGRAASAMFAGARAHAGSS